MSEEIILVHHGIKGQKWGVRRFQNEDGTRTAAGKKRERQAAGFGTLLSKNESTAARKYQEAKKASIEEVTKFNNPESMTDKDWADYDRRTNAAIDARKQAFKESKADFKANKTTGQKVANALINGPIGAGVYNNMRASGYSVATSEAAVIVSTALGGPLGQSAAYLLTRRGV